MELLKNVAFADDQIDILKVLQLATQSKYQILGTATTGTEAIALVKEKKPELLIMDVHMPKVSGLEALAQIVPLGTTAVVILTGDESAEVGRKAMDLGASGYGTKPIETSAIVPMMEAAWHRFQTVKTLREEMKTLSETLETRKLLEKAKGILMEQQGYTEDEAHRTLQKMAQDQGITLKELCRSLIQVRMVLGGKVKNRKVA